MGVFCNLQSNHWGKMHWKRYRGIGKSTEELKQNTRKYLINSKVDKKEKKRGTPPTKTRTDVIKKQKSKIKDIKHQKLYLM